MPADLARDGHRHLSLTAESPARRAYAVTPADTDMAAGPANAKALYVGGAGTLRILPQDNADNEPVDFVCSAGAIIPVQVRRVYATGTTATGIVALVY